MASPETGPGGKPFFPGHPEPPMLHRPQGIPEYGTPQFLQPQFLHRIRPAAVMQAEPLS